MIIFHFMSLILSFISVIQLHNCTHLLHNTHHICLDGRHEYNDVDGSLEVHYIVYCIHALVHYNTIPYIYVYRKTSSTNPKCISCMLFRQVNDILFLPCYIFFYMLIHQSLNYILFLLIYFRIYIHIWFLVHNEHMGPRGNFFHIYVDSLCTIK